MEQNKNRIQQEYDNIANIHDSLIHRYVEQ